MTGQMPGQTAVHCCSQTKQNYNLNNEHCKRKLCFLISFFFKEKNV